MNNISYYLIFPNKKKKWILQYVDIVSAWQINLFPVRAFVYQARTHDKFKYKISKEQNKEQFSILLLLFLCILFQMNLQCTAKPLLMLGLFIIHVISATKFVTRFSLCQSVSSITYFQLSQMCSHLFINYYHCSPAFQSNQKTWQGLLLENRDALNRLNSINDN